MLSQKCFTDPKIQACFKKFEIKKVRDKEKQKGKDEKDLRWLATVEAVTDRDRTCRIWNILTVKEQQYIIENNHFEFQKYGKILTCVHIVARSKSQDEIYNLNNITLISLYFHRLLDSFYHPVTRSNITREQRLLWLQSAYEGIRIV
jgi:hypothetical protein